MADDADVAAMVERTVATFGRLDMAFDNAGVRGFLPLDSSSSVWL